MRSAAPVHGGDQPAFDLSKPELGVLVGPPPGQRWLGTVVRAVPRPRLVGLSMKMVPVTGDAPLAVMRSGTGSRRAIALRSGFRRKKRLSPAVFHGPAAHRGCRALARARLNHDADIDHIAGFRPLIVTSHDVSRYSFGAAGGYRSLALTPQWWH